jgi:pentatricopeptide repeat protein
MLEEACRFLLSECGKASRFRRISLSLSSSLAWGTDTTAAAAAAATSLVVFKEFIGDRKNTYANAVDAYQWIKENKLTPCARIYNQLLRVVNDRSKKGSASEDNTQWQQKKQLKQDELFRLFLVFQEMRVSGVQIDAATYNTLINACAAAGDLEKAIETVQAMQEEGILPNVITYTSLIKACRYNGAPGCVQLAEYYFAV